MTYRLPQLAAAMLMLRILWGTAGPAKGADDPANQYQPGDGPHCVAIADLNGDGFPDLAVANQFSNSVSILVNNGRGGFGLKGKFPAGVAPIAIGLRDLDGDGRSDMIVLNSRSDTVSVMRGRGDGSFGSEADYPTGRVPYALAVADLNLDGWPDLVVANRYGSSISIFMNRCDGTLEPRTDYRTSSLPYSVAVVGIGRELPHLIVTHSFDQTVSILPVSKSGTLGELTELRREGGGYCTLTDDLNGDGIPDLVQANRYGNSVGVRLSRPGVGFGASAQYSTGNGPWSVAAADLNKDGAADLVVASIGSYPSYSGTVSVLLGKGNGKFAAKLDYATGSYSHSVALGDLNCDGNVDVVVANGSYDFGGTVSVLFGRDDGTLWRRADYVTGGHAVPVAIDEADSSGAPDPFLVRVKVR